MTIEISDKAAELLAHQAATQGKTVEEWILELAERSSTVGLERTNDTRKAAEDLLDLRNQVKPDPEGLTFHDYIRMGRR
ncbi:hypothetical protein F183_A47540 [Bryobacterales bacterium F-183]|nr:hypothetical protein F183_A47540 [Bryobacterales bacterium F-183]